MLVILRLFRLRLGERSDIGTAATTIMEMERFHPFCFFLEHYERAYFVQINVKKKAAPHPRSHSCTIGDGVDACCFVASTFRRLVCHVFLVIPSLVSIVYVALNGHFIL